MWPHPRPPTTGTTTQHYRRSNMLQHAPTSPLNLSGIHDDSRDATAPTTTPPRCGRSNLAPNQLSVMTPGGCAAAARTSSPNPPGERQGRPGYTASARVPPRPLSGVDPREPRDLLPASSTTAGLALRPLPRPPRPLARNVGETWPRSGRANLSPKPSQHRRGRRGRDSSI